MSQPYPSTLPGIPKGSARQLFQRLQGPMEENILKSHFEKVMSFRRKQHHQKIRKKEVHDHKHIFPIHHSHAIALSEVSSHYQNGFCLSPLDLCDLPLPSLDSITLGSENMHSEVPPSGDKFSYQGTPGLVTGSTSHVRTSKPSPSINEQHKFNSMSTQLASPSVSGTKSVIDRNTVRTVPDANSAGMMGGLSSHVSRLKSQETSESPISIARGITSSGMIGMQNHVNPRVNSSQGTSTSNFSGTYTMLNQESQRQMIAQGNNQGTTRKLSSTLSSHNSTPMGQIPPVHNQPPRQMPPHQSHGLNRPPRVRGRNVLQHPAYAHLVKEQKLQQQQSSAPNIAILQSPMLSQATPLAPVRPLPSPVTLSSQPQHLPPQGFNLTTQTGSSVVVNQIGRIGRQSSNPVIPSPHRPQQLESQQSAKFANGGVPANISTSQSGTQDSSHTRKISPPVLGLPAEQLASVYGGLVHPLRPQAPQALGHHRSCAPKSISYAAKSSVVASRNLQLNKKLKSIPKSKSEISKNMEKEKQQNHLSNTEKKSKDAIEPDRLGEHVMNSTPASTPAALSHVTGSTGCTSMKSSSNNLLRTGLGLYDSVLENFDTEMLTAEKEPNIPAEIKPDPRVNKGLVPQMQSSSGMIPPKPNASKQPDQHCVELKRALSSHPAIN